MPKIDFNCDCRTCLHDPDPGTSCKESDCWGSLGYKKYERDTRVRVHFMLTQEQVKRLINDVAQGHEMECEDLEHAINVMLGQYGIECYVPIKTETKNLFAKTSC